MFSAAARAWAIQKVAEACKNIEPERTAAVAATYAPQYVRAASAAEHAVGAAISALSGSIVIDIQRDSFVVSRYEAGLHMQTVRAFGTEHLLGVVDAMARGVPPCHIPPCDEQAFFEAERKGDIDAMQALLSKYGLPLSRSSPPPDTGARTAPGPLEDAAPPSSNKADASRPMQ